MKLYEVIINDSGAASLGIFRFNGMGGTTYYVEASSFDDAAEKAMKYLIHKNEIDDMVKPDNVLDFDGSLKSDLNKEVEYTVKSVNVISEILIK